MPQTEYKGSKYKAWLVEMRNIGISGVFFRANYELSKKLGRVERKHPAGGLSVEDVINSLDLENPSLGSVREAYESRNMDRAVAELIKHFKFRRRPSFFFDWREREQYQKLLRKWFAHEEAQLVEQANRVCQHEFGVFGSDSVKFGEEVNWHLDPSSGKSWPLEHWSKIDVRGPDRVGDARITWEINRHQFFFILGRAYWFTGDEKYAREFASLIRSWIDANPPEIGVNWYSNLEIAMRLISWIWAYHYFLDSPYLDDDLHTKFLKTVLHSCRHITRDFRYSLRSMKNNHVIGDAAALAFTGIMFPEFKDSKHWKETYLSILRRELDTQVYDDGADFEQAISYHRFVLYFYLMLLRIMQINDHDVPASFTGKLEKMMEFALYVMKPDKTMPQIGDCDDAGVMLLSNSKSHDFSPILSTGAVLFQRGDFKQIAGKLSEETFWLSGKEGVQTFNSLEGSAPSDSSRSFPDGGYHIMRSGWDAHDRYLLLKCGPHADHAHADALHIEMYCSGQSCLRDCGTYTYNGPWEWRTFFRSTRAHNTVMVDGESQSIPHRVFRWLKVARPRTLSWITSAGFDYVDAEHDGYSRYKDPVTHRRAVFFVKPDYWIIVDRLVGRGEHSVELLFHTPRGEHETEESTKILRMEDFAIIPAIRDGIDMDLHEHSEEPIQGWFSPYYGSKEPSSTLVYSFSGKLPKIMATILDAGCSILNVQSSSTEEALEINVEINDFNDKFVFNSGERSSELDTDAEVVYFREDKASGKIIRLVLVDGSYVRLGGRMLLEAKARIRSIDVAISSSGKAQVDIRPEVDFQLGF